MKASRAWSSRRSKDGPAGDSITVETHDASEGGEANDQFKLIVKRGEKVEETFDNVDPAQGRQQRRHEGEGRVAS